MLEIVCVGDKFEIFYIEKLTIITVKLHKVVTNIIMNVTICYRENLKDPHFLTLIFSLYRISNEMN